MNGFQKKKKKKKNGTVGYFETPLSWDCICGQSSTSSHGPPRSPNTLRTHGNWRLKLPEALQSMALPHHRAVFSNLGNTYDDPRHMKEPEAYSPSPSSVFRRPRIPISPRCSLLYLTALTFTRISPRVSSSLLSLPCIEEYCSVQATRQFVSSTDVFRLWYLALGSRWPQITLKLISPSCSSRCNA